MATVPSPSHSLSDDDLLALPRREEQAAAGYQDSVLSAIRAEALVYYDRRRIGGEVEGRSQVVTSKFADVVESLMPGLMRVFTGTVDLATFSPLLPGQERLAKEASEYVPHVLMCQNDGRATPPASRECFAGGRFAHRWRHRQIDSRSVGMTNKAQIAEWVKDYGEDSDFIRVRVRGVFPRAGSMQFIDSERVDQAIARDLVEDPTAALVMGVDIARQGADQTVIRLRRGLDARSIPAVKFRIPDLMLIASRVMELVHAHSPDAVFIDSTGIGWGVHDRLAQLGCPNLTGVDFGGAADRHDAANAGARYANKRAEMWGFMKEWCRQDCLPDDRDLAADLTGVEYGYDASDALLLERKDDMRRRGLASPDDGDALALTFAYPVIKRDWAEERRIEEKLKQMKRRFL